MENYELSSWINVNQFMSNEYRELVIQLALNHFRESSSELTRYSRQILNSKIKVPGFRSFTKAPAPMQLSHAINRFNASSEACSMIIGLWAEFMTDELESYLNALKDAGFCIPIKWSWKFGIEGFYPFDTNPNLSGFTREFIKDMNFPEQDHHLLAELWFSSGIIGLEEDDLYENAQLSHKIPVSETRVAEIQEQIDDHNEVEEEEKDLVSEEIIQTSSTTEPTPGSPTVKENWVGMDFDESHTTILERESIIEEIRRKVNLILDEMNLATANDNYQELVNKHIELENSINEWDNFLKEQESFLSFLNLRIQKAISRRPDLSETIGVSDKIFEVNPCDKQELILSQLKSIMKYDQKREELIIGIKEAQAELVGLLEELNHWNKSDDEKANSLLGINRITKQTIENLIPLTKQIQASQRDLSQRIKNYRSLSIGNIKKKVEAIIDVLPKNNRVQVNDLDQINQNYLTNLSSPELRELEGKIDKTHDEIIIKFGHGAASENAEELLKEWNDEIFINLIHGLAIDKKDVEAFLIQVGATKLNLIENQKFFYEDNEVNCLLNGLGNLSDKSNPFEFVCCVAPFFFNDWRPINKSKTVEICLILFAAYSTYAYDMDIKYLWEFSETWPDADMPTWKMLWENLLLETPLQIHTDHLEIQYKKDFDESKKDADDAIMKDGAHYIRLNSMKSQRQQSMISSEFMPNFEDTLAKLKKYERAISNSSPDHLRVNLEKLNNFLVELKENSFSENVIDSAFDSAIFTHNINDEDYFRIRGLDNVKDCARRILEYGIALHKYWNLLETQRTGIQSKTLLEELSNLPTLTTLGNISKELFFEIYSNEPTIRTANPTKRTINQQIINQLVDERTFILRVPRLVEFFVNNSFDWNQVYYRLLLDISQPLEPEELGKYLLSSKAIMQALNIHELLSKELQADAQEQLKTIENGLNHVVNTFDDLGGPYDDFFIGGKETFRWNWKLGRWGHIETVINKAIDLINEEHKKAKERENQEARQVFQEINTLTQVLFDKEASTPPKAYEKINQGLDIARKYCKNLDLQISIKEYLSQIRYWVDRNVWPVNEIIQATNEFVSACENIETEDIQDISLETILKAFDNKEYKYLGFNEENFDTSKRDTRRDLLYAWKQVNNIEGFLSQNLTSIERTAIRKLYSFFAQMTSMSRGLDVNEKHIREISPTVFEFWKLKYPKTSALQEPCVFITLPGPKPISSDINELLNFLDERSFEPFNFVIVFSPGCTIEIAERIIAQRGGKKIIIINSKLIKKMILAERFGRLPLEILRSEMMQSVGYNAEIFDINHATNDKTGIFVGRDKLIDRIVSSNENYAIYGGRRIGKSSVLLAAKEKLENRNSIVKYKSLDGEKSFSDEYVSEILAEEIGIDWNTHQGKDFKHALINHMNEHPGLNLVLMLDEFDGYIKKNTDRHLLIETLRDCSIQFGSRFRVIIAGFMSIYDCLKFRGPYSPNSDPWSRTFTDNGPLGNLDEENAEKIIREGFVGILGWDFENRMIPQRIVMKTSGHPNFVQCFCKFLLEDINKNERRTITTEDVERVFNNQDPEKSFIAHVKKTLNMNLDILSRYILIWLASEYQNVKTFTFDQVLEMADVLHVEFDKDIVTTILEKLSVTSVVKQPIKNVYEFSVPDYPIIIERLGGTSDLEEIETKLKTKYRDNPKDALNEY